MSQPLSSGLDENSQQPAFACENITFSQDDDHRLAQRMQPISRGRSDIKLDSLQNVALDTTLISSRMMVDEATKPNQEWKQQYAHSSSVGKQEHLLNGVRRDSAMEEDEVEIFNLRSFQATTSSWSHQQIQNSKIALEEKRETFPEMDSAQNKYANDMPSPHQSTSKTRDASLVSSVLCTSLRKISVHNIQAIAAPKGVGGLEQLEQDSFNVRDPEHNGSQGWNVHPITRQSSVAPFLEVHNTGLSTARLPDASAVNGEMILEEQDATATVPATKAPSVVLRRGHDVVAENSSTGLAGLNQSSVVVSRSAIIEGGCSDSTKVYPHGGKNQALAVSQTGPTCHHQESLQDNASSRGGSMNDGASVSSSVTEASVVLHSDVVRRSSLLRASPSKYTSSRSLETGSKRKLGKPGFYSDKDLDDLHALWRTEYDASDRMDFENGRARRRRIEGGTHHRLRGRQGKERSYNQPSSDDDHADRDKHEDEEEDEEEDENEENDTTEDDDESSEDSDVDDGLVQGSEPSSKRKGSSPKRSHRQEQGRHRHRRKNKDLTLETKRHQCPICEKRFSRPSQLETHRLTHTGEKPYICPHCQKDFNVASNLKRHIRTHTNGKRNAVLSDDVVYGSNTFLLKIALETAMELGLETGKSSSNNSSGSGSGSGNSGDGRPQSLPLSLPLVVSPSRRAQPLQLQLRIHHAQSTLEQRQLQQQLSQQPQQEGRDGWKEMTALGAICAVPSNTVVVPGVSIGSTPSTPEQRTLFSKPSFLIGTPSPSLTAPLTLPVTAVMATILTTVPPSLHPHASIGAAATGAIDGSGSVRSAEKDS
ncbi:hypothetical protein EDD11_009710 [Mortierella claussenii]|nr:hypothetical protein EDD11_009710 [Mortierella claussenii]